MSDRNYPPRLTGCWKTLSQLFFIPQRYILAIMAFFGIINVFTTRICLSIAINTIVNITDPQTFNVSDSCPEPTAAETIKLTSALFHWGSEEKNLLLSAFYWGYLLSHMPGGIIAERFGGKHVFGFGLFIAAVTTLLTGVVTNNFGWPGLLTLRIIMGLGQGVVYPALSALLAFWIPQNERSSLTTLAFSGLQLGTIIGNALTGWLIEYTRNWESVFYVYGSSALVWCFVWQLVCYSRPETHPFIKDQEYYYLKERLPEPRVGMRAPWAGIFTNVHVWALIFTSIGHDWGLFTILTDLPVYMSEVLKFRIKENGLLSALPYVFMWLVAIVSALIADYLISRNKCSVTAVRKTFTAVAATIPPAFLLGASYSGCNRTLAMVMFCISIAFMGMLYPGWKVNSLDLSPNYAGTLTALINGFGTFGGTVAPIAIGFITQNHTIGEWRVVFWVCFAIMLTSGLVFLIWGSGEVQDFDSEKYVFPGCCKRINKD